MKNSKVSRGPDFLGLLKYLAGHDDAQIVGGNMSGTTPLVLAMEFGCVSVIREDIAKPTWMIALSLTPGETVSIETWRALTDDFYVAMGFSENHQRVTYLHNKKNQQHCHLAANRIGLDGSVFYGRNENLRATKIVAMLEIKYGLKITKTAEINPATGLPSTRTSKKRPVRAEIEKAFRTGFKPLRLVIQSALDQALSFATDVDQLAAELEKRGVLMDLKADRFGKVIGIVFASGELNFSGSSLGDSYKVSMILKILMENREHVRNENGETTSITERLRSSGAYPEIGIEPGADSGRTQSSPTAIPESGCTDGSTEEETPRLKTRFRP